MGRLFRTAFYGYPNTYHLVVETNAVAAELNGPATKHYRRPTEVRTMDTPEEIRVRTLGDNYWPAW